MNWNHDEVTSYQFLWFCIDAENSIAIFNSAGSDLVPPSIFDMSEKYYDSCLSWFLNKEKISESISIHEAFDEEWQEFSEKGFYLS